VMPTNPINSFKRLFSVGVRTRTSFSLQWGRCSSGDWVRGRWRAVPIWKFTSNANDYIKDQPSGKQDVKIRYWVGYLETDSDTIQRVPVAPALPDPVVIFSNRRDAGKRLLRLPRDNKFRIDTTSHFRATG